MTTTSQKLLLVEDYPAHREATEKLLRKAGYDVVGVGDSQSALKKLTSGHFDLVITDLNLPDFDGIELLKRVKADFPAAEVVLLTGNATIERAVEAMKLGAYDFVEKQDNLRVALLKTVGKALEKHSLQEENRELREKLQLRQGADLLIGTSKSIAAIRKLAAQIADADVSVLIEGESGTGKEVVADMIHQLSHRRNRPILKISCAAIPETLLESELFGYEKGAFTGATGTKPGRFETAHDGTLFLDEIGEMNPPLQAKLLRVLQDGRFQRLGGTKDIEVDVRVISATNINIAKALEEKKFREDLFYRLNVVHIVVPPMRARMEDLLLLADFFLKRYAQQMQKPARKFGQGALEKLAAYHWPGNVRQLENVIQRAVAMCAGDVLSPADLAIPFGAANGAKPTADGPAVSIPIGTTMAEVESRVISETLKICDNDKEKAAKVLGISSRTIYRRTNDE